MCKIKIGIKALEKSHMFIEDFKKDGDDSNLNWGCFMLQQAMELMLKGLCETYGEECAFGHMLSDNVEVLKGLYDKAPDLKELDDVLDIANQKSYIYISWETKSRYSRFNATEKNIEDAFMIADRLKDYIDIHKLKY